MVLNRICWVGVGVLMVCCWIVVQGLEFPLCLYCGKANPYLSFTFPSHAVVGGPGILAVGARSYLLQYLFMWA